MNLTTELLAPFVGGQIEIQNQGEGYLFRGEIKSAEVAGPNLRVELNWLAKGEGYPPIPKKWVITDHREYFVDLSVGSANNIGPSGDGSGDRICINTHPAIGELIVLYPADGSKLDPSQVEGFTVPSSS